ncbi:hypothetical protein [Angustibacter luteus]|uniref:Thioesterase family protein n=1 Tax=Angustibacter luteus TaxID=658456 RepID=A0ABW1JBC7_9ACTN
MTTPALPDLVVPSRFNGPPHSGNGGWTCGALATMLPAADLGSTSPVVQVRLSAPPPLDVPMQVAGREGSVTASDSRGPVATAVAVPSPFTAAAPEPVSWEVASAAEARYRGLADHPFPTCFSCGTARDDGLGLRPGPLLDRPDVTACTWTPDGSDGSDIGGPVTWAALDCPGGWSVDLAGRPMVLGTMTTRLDAAPRAGQRHVVMGRVLRQEGRKAWTETALYALGRSDAAPRLLARAAAVWIAVDVSAVSAAPRNDAQ